MCHGGESGTKATSCDAERPDAQAYVAGFIGVSIVPYGYTRIIRRRRCRLRRATMLPYGAYGCDAPGGNGGYRAARSAMRILSRERCAEGDGEWCIRLLRTIRSLRRCGLRPHLDRKEMLGR